MNDVLLPVATLNDHEMSPAIASLKRQDCLQNPSRSYISIIHEERNRCLTYRIEILMQRRGVVYNRSSRVFPSLPDTFKECRDYNPLHSLKVSRGKGCSLYLICLPDDYP